MFHIPDWCMGAPLDDGRAEPPGNPVRLTRASKGYRDKERPDGFPRHFRIGAPLHAGAGGMASELVVPGPLETKGSGKPPQLGG
jgi:hypothetical protein